VAGLDDFADTALVLFSSALTGPVRVLRGRRPTVHLPHRRH